ncbi:MAG: hypothetical protein WBQ93_03705 [Candidatus Competibacter sp.]
MEDRAFYGRTAIFNGVLFALCIAAIRFVDANLKSHVIYGARIYPFGYWAAAIGGSLIVAITHIALVWLKSWKAKIVLPSLVVLIAGACSLPIFQPEIPHAGVVLWSLTISIVSLLSCSIRLWPISRECLEKAGVSEAARVERVKEHANLWRMIAVSSLFGTIGLLFPWAEFVWKMPPRIVSDSREAFLLGQADAMRLGLVCVYILFGVVYESFRKSAIASDLLLLVKSSSSRRMPLRPNPSFHRTLRDKAAQRR